MGNVEPESHAERRVRALTGVGKTNVPMPAVVSHLHNVGLIGSALRGDDDDNNNNNNNGHICMGKKIVYIVPMKALAQEVVAKFSSKLKPLGIIIKV